MIFVLDNVNDVARVLDDLRRFAWDGPIRFARWDTSLLFDLGPLGANLARLGQALGGRAVGIVDPAPDLEWTVFHDPCDIDG
jgi:hypothetical protein